jgi:hypothetical protein
LIAVALEGDAVFGEVRTNLVVFSPANANGVSWIMGVRRMLDAKEVGNAAQG